MSILLHDADRPLLCTRTMAADTSGRHVGLVITAFIAVLVPCGPLPPVAEPLRVWKDAAGDARWAATFESLDGEEVVRVLIDDRRTPIPLNWLSAADRTYVREVVARRGPDKTALIEDILRPTRQRKLARVGQVEGFKVGLGMWPGTIPPA